MESVFQQMPVRVHWLGWESDTYTLRRCGWQVFANEQMSPYRFAQLIRLILKDPHEALIISGEFEIELGMVGRGQIQTHDFYEMVCQRGIDMKCYRGTDRVYTYPVVKASFDEAFPCDGFIGMPEECDFKDLKFFKYTEHPKEILIPLQSVDECLNRILQLQYPEQKVLASKQQLIKPTAECKIYSLAA